jgi:hypothetical protein
MTPAPGWKITYDMLKGASQVGDRLVPSRIEAEVWQGEGIPVVSLVMEVINEVPRCTELTVRSGEGTREVRQKDLRSIELDSWVEILVANAAGQVTRTRDGMLSASWPIDPSAVQPGRRTIAESRKGSRRALTDALWRRVAGIYLSQDSLGLEAVEAAFGVSRSTAARYVRASREAGHIGPRGEK